MKPFLLFFHLLILSIFVNAQEVINVSFIQTGEDLEVTYEINRVTGKRHNVRLFYSVDDGYSYTECQSVEGDVGKAILLKKRNKIIWHVLEDVEELEGNLRFKVEYFKGITSGYISPAVYFGMGNASYVQPPNFGLKLGVMGTGPVGGYLGMRGIDIETADETQRWSGLMISGGFNYFMYNKNDLKVGPFLELSYITADVTENGEKTKESKAAAGVGVMAVYRRVGFSFCWTEYVNQFMEVGVVFKFKKTEE